MRGNCTEAVCRECLTVAKTAAPMGAMTAGKEEDEDELHKNRRLVVRAR